MKRILVTGATGNIGLEVVHYLSELNSDSEILAAVRNIDKAKKTFKNYPNLHYRKFDFENESTFSEAFDQVDILFLLRPPHISDVEEVFRPLLNSAEENGINKVVFLSVQGAEKSKVIPHNKIERLVQELQFDYIFVRPSYFMQNLTTTLLPEILTKKSITLPSGKAKFNWIDVKDIGESTATLIAKFENYQNQAYEITGTENKNFGDVADLMTDITGERIRFNSINPISFYFRKKKEGLNGGFAMVMTILHFLPRLQAEPKISDNYQKLTGKVPTTLQEFIEREKEKITTPQQRL
ncbi:NmrA family NAD(P)-binding protein [Tenacibaculum finnmarkense]|nr:NmrA family NAD(P)-binding protein [Tenacibaculum finnmarkense]MCG8763564.1 NmrA family NAD(P)-binding protein [Tenacibaculum finnmarkense]MCG8788947.1 NmrA family NAD(P)-binding protein [Tenacibaculum finnmarkense]